MAISGVGTKFLYYDKPSGASGALTHWKETAEVNSISGPSFSRERIDVTTLNTEGGYREFISSFRDGGEVTLQTNFTKDQYKVFFDNFNKDDLGSEEATLYYAVSFADAPLVESEATVAGKAKNRSAIVFAGFVVSAPVDIQMEDRVTVEITIKVSGKPVFRNGTGLPTDPAVSVSKLTVTAPGTNGILTLNNGGSNSNIGVANGANLPKPTGGEFPLEFAILDYFTRNPVTDVLLTVDGSVTGDTLASSSEQPKAYLDASPTDATTLAVYRVWNNDVSVEVPFTLIIAT